MVGNLFLTKRTLLILTQSVYQRKLVGGFSLHYYYYDYHHTNTDAWDFGILALADKPNPDGKHLEEDSQLCHYLCHSYLALGSFWNLAKQLPRPTLLRRIAGSHVENQILNELNLPKLNQIIG